MDLSLVVISALLLVTAGVDGMPEDQSQRGNSSTLTPGNSSTVVPPVQTTATTTSSTVPPSLGLLTVTWTQQCTGYVRVMPKFPYDRTFFTVCHSETINVKEILQNVCQNKKGCYDKPSFDKGRQINGYDIEKRADDIPCNMLAVKCKAEILPDIDGQLHTYKVVTALLSCVLLILLLIRFTRPTVKALQKKLSDKRQNRWIGPTQSHSVSYHRGKSTAVNNDGEKRLSYPALERLAISNSREPSSNRNSGYNF